MPSPFRLRCQHRNLRRHIQIIAPQQQWSHSKSTGDSGPAGLTVKVCGMGAYCLSPLILVPWSSPLTLPTWPLLGDGITLKSGCDAHGILAWGVTMQSLAQVHSDPSTMTILGRCNPAPSASCLLYPSREGWTSWKPYTTVTEDLREKSGGLTENFPLT